MEWSKQHTARIWMLLGALALIVGLRGAVIATEGDIAQPAYAGLAILGFVVFVNGAIERGLSRDDSHIT